VAQLWQIQAVDVLKTGKGEMGKYGKTLSLGVLSVSSPEFVFISNNGSILAAKEISRKNDEPNRIVTSCIDLLQECSFVLANIDQFIVLSGPGSLTGIRVGLSPIRAWSYATGKPVIALSSLEVMAHAMNKPVLAMMPARKDHFWVQAFNDSFMDTPRIVEKSFLEPYDNPDWTWICPKHAEPAKAHFVQRNPSPELASELAATKKAQPWMRALPNYLFEMENGNG
jgi:tRNA threonylcarbamoyl adenosine modification protein YeaZ